MKNEYGKEIANPCPHCKGWGVRVDSSYPDYYEEYPCPKCNATGVATEGPCKPTVSLTL